MDFQYYSIPERSDRIAQLFLSFDVQTERRAILYGAHESEGDAAIGRRLYELMLIERMIEQARMGQA